MAVWICMYVLVGTVAVSVSVLEQAGMIAVCGGNQTDHVFEGEERAIRTIRTEQLVHTLSSHIRIMSAKLLNVCPTQPSSARCPPSQGPPQPGYTSRQEWVWTPFSMVIAPPVCRDQGDRKLLAHFNLSSGASVKQCPPSTNPPTHTPLQPLLTIITPLRGGNEALINFTFRKEGGKTIARDGWKE